MQENEENTPSWRWMARWVLLALLYGVVFPVAVNVLTAIILGNTPTQSFYTNDNASIQVIALNDGQRVRAIA